MSPHSSNTDLGPLKLGDFLPDALSPLYDWLLPPRGEAIELPKISALLNLPLCCLIDDPRPLPPRLEASGLLYLPSSLGGGPLPFPPGGENV